MVSRRTVTGLAAAMSAIAAAPALGQTIHYEDGDYLYAVPSEAREDIAPPAPPEVRVDGAPVSSDASAPIVLQPVLTEPLPTLNIALPQGARVVEFDRVAWLEACRTRLAAYHESDRARVLGFAQGRWPVPRLYFGNDTVGTPDFCGAYLDEYFARAQNRSLAGATVAGGDYLLVPVSIPVARQPAETP